MKECSQKNNSAQCTCTYEPCPRKGFCCECLTYHRRNGEIPACYFDARTERTYDRSVANFIRAHKGTK
ncbi:MAG: DUF6485 family protein [Deltaproteobacteria bacterium]|nr:DUF6485 family protein [Deltaproteobacteria bacterium]